VFPPQTNDFQKHIKFVSTLGKVFFGKESEKASEGKLIEKSSKEKPVEKPSGEKPSEQPHPNPKPKPIRFHVAIVGEMAIRMSFASRRSERREWRRSGLTRASTTPLMVYLSLVCRCPGPRRV
jgi:hypothetical protein